MIGLEHPLLDGHAAIAWDLDGTLIDGPRQAFLGAYLAGRRDKRHHLVTFRRASQREVVASCLSVAGLGLHLFDGVHFCPDFLRDAYDGGADPALVREFRRWKGRTAAETGCTVLVDDDADLVGDGCRIHGIVHVDSWSRSFPHLRTPSPAAAPAVDGASEPAP
jgi:hypothetical protein